MGCTSSKEVPLRDRPIRRAGGAYRGPDGTAENAHDEFWRQAVYMQEAKLRDHREDIARAQGMGRTDEYGNKLARYNKPLRM
jgi:hypothetical protein